MQKCVACQYYDRNAADTEEKGVRWGQCRRTGPIVHPLSAKAYMIEGVWPHVRDDDWCGEFKGLGKRLEAQLSELMNDPIMSALGAEASISPLFIPINTPRDSGPSNNGD